jgi:hypothetical protein
MRAKIRWGEEYFGKKAREAYWSLFFLFFVSALIVFGE